MGAFVTDGASFYAIAVICIALPWVFFKVIFGGGGPSSATTHIPTYRCVGGHVHHSQAAVDKCPALKTWFTDYSAGRVDYQGNPIPQPGELRACEKCGRNHFAEDCPPTGYRAIDGRTGEVVGHWVPKDA
jgi:hypothetical protein